MKKRIYLDHNATTPLHPAVKKKLAATFDTFGNPSSLHSFGREAKRELFLAREETASFINASADEIIFTGSGSEANNTVLSILTCETKRCSYTGELAGSQIITTSIEHPCIMETSKCIEARGVKLTYLPVDKYGKIDPADLKKAISQNTALVSIMMANNEIGTLQDVKELCRICHEKGVLFHTDAVQAAGKLPIDAKDLDVDFLTVSGHKIYGPKGIGALYVKRGTPFCPLIRGGHQEKGRRAGTENVLGIIGMAEAIKMRKQEMVAEDRRLTELKELLVNGIKDNIDKVSFNGHPTDSLVSTVNVSFEGAEGEAILLYLDAEGIAVSTGSACASGSLDPSHVLLACGIPPEKAHGSIRFSMGRETTKDDIKYVLNVLPKVIEKVRDISSI